MTSTSRELQRFCNACQDLVDWLETTRGSQLNFSQLTELCGELNHAAESVIPSPYVLLPEHSPCRLVGQSPTQGHYTFDLYRYDEDEGRFSVKSVEEHDAIRKEFIALIRQWLRRLEANDIPVAEPGDEGELTPPEAASDGGRIKPEGDEGTDSELAFTFPDSLLIQFRKAWAKYTGEIIWIEARKPGQDFPDSGTCEYLGFCELPPIEGHEKGEYNLLLFWSENEAAAREWRSVAADAGACLTREIRHALCGGGLCEPDVLWCLFLFRENSSHFDDISLQMIGEGSFACSAFVPWMSPFASSVDLVERSGTHPDTPEAMDAAGVSNDLATTTPTTDTAPFDERGKSADGGGEDAFQQAIPRLAACKGDMEVVKIASDETKTVEQRLRGICDGRREYWFCDSPEFAKMLGCSDAAVRQTKFWKEDLPRLRETEKQHAAGAKPEQQSDIRQKTD